MLWFKVQVMVQELAPRVLKGSELQEQSLHYTENHICARRPRQRSKHPFNVENYDKPSRSAANLHAAHVFIISKYFFLRRMLIN